jgi:hypothetical protein
MGVYLIQGVEFTSPRIVRCNKDKRDLYPVFLVRKSQHSIISSHLVILETFHRRYCVGCHKILNVSKEKVASK